MNTIEVLKETVANLKLSLSHSTTSTMDKYLYTEITRLESLIEYLEYELLTIQNGYHAIFY